MTLKTILIDDELACTHSLAIELNAYCTDIEVIKAFNDPSEAIIYLLKEQQPDVVFLDIEMGVMTGFDLLNKLKNINFEVIFVTAHDNYAVKAFEYCAIDYLMKPVLKHRLIEAVDKIKKRRENKNNLPLIWICCKEQCRRFNNSYLRFRFQLPMGWNSSEWMKLCMSKLMETMHISI